MILGVSSRKTDLHRLGHLLRRDRSRLWCGVLAGVIALTGISITLRVNPNRDATPPDHEIFENGDARFTTMDGSSKVVLWTVTCPRPLRGCTARSRGLFLRVDAEGRGRLSGVAPETALISIDTGTRLIPAPDIFRAPLTAVQVGLLSEDGAALLVKSEDRRPEPFETAGLATVLGYLAFVGSPTAHALRDARAWRADGRLVPSEMEPEVRHRYETLRLREAETGT